MVQRYVVSVALASVVTFGLFFVMTSLIALGEGKIGEGGDSHRIEFVRVKRDSSLQTKKRELPELEKPNEPPPPPDLDLSDSFDPSKSSLEISAPAPDVDIALEGGLSAGAMSDTDTVPIVRVAPQYPIRASERGIEGWVVVEFTIDPTGKVVDPKIVSAEPPRIFDRAALRAIKKWKYKPKVVDGEPVERPGVQTKLTFQLDT